MARLTKNDARLRRARRTRAKIRELRVPRLTVHRSGRHTYAQVILVDGKVVASVSTLQKEVAKGLSSLKNKEAAARVGTAVGEKAIAAGVKRVAFDRSGFAYMGRLRCLADAAREAGLEF